jgi:hypothetical protein
MALPGFRFSRACPRKLGPPEAFFKLGRGRIPIRIDFVLVGPPSVRLLFCLEATYQAFIKCRLFPKFVRTQFEAFVTKLDTCLAKPKPAPINVDYRIARAVIIIALIQMLDIAMLVVPEPAQLACFLVVEDIE